MAYWKKGAIAMLKKPMFLKGSFFFDESYVIIFVHQAAGIHERPSCLVGGSKKSLVNPLEIQTGTK